MNREEYLERMASAPQFERFNVTPFWRPGEGDIEGFCVDEVIRQYHDINVEEDGGWRVNWMVGAWKWAAEMADKGLPTAMDVLRIGHQVEPTENSPTRFRAHHVSVGGRECPDPKDVPHLIANLWTTIEDVVPKQGRSDFYSTSGFGTDAPTADDFYVEFEQIHPFIDGNGRTGKILHNWLLGTLDNPVLVDDYFGGSIP